MFTYRQMSMRKSFAIGSIQLKCDIVLKYFGWSVWLALSHFGSLFWLPVTAILSMPLYKVLCVLDHSKHQMKIVKELKDFFDTLALYSSSGYAYKNALLLSLEERKESLPSGHPFYEDYQMFYKKMKLDLFSMDELLLKALAANQTELVSLSKVLKASRLTGQKESDSHQALGKVLSDVSVQYETTHMLLSQKRMEMHILLLMPGIALMAIQKTSPEYLACLKHTMGGQVLLCVSVMVLNASYWIFHYNQHRILDHS